MTKARLLIIDDMADVRAEVKERIESLGHETDEAASQEEALKKIREIQYACVLLDLAIPMKHEGVARIDHGKNLLQQIVAMSDAPPVIVITSNGLDGHILAVDMMENGAKSFVGKPFDAGQLEPKIQQILANKKNAPAQQAAGLTQFTGGALVMNDDGIALCGILVGGVRANANIRGMLQILSIKSNEKYVKATAKQLADKITGTPNPASLTAAIKEFREQCTTKLREGGIDCTGNAVIETVRGGGYRLREWIEVRIGREGELASATEEDSAQVMRVFNREKKLTSKQLRASVTLSPIRIKAAMEALEERGKIKNIGGSGSATTYELISA